MKSFDYKIKKFIENYKGGIKSIIFCKIVTVLNHAQAENVAEEVF